MNRRRDEDGTAAAGLFLAAVLVTAVVALWRIGSAIQELTETVARLSL